MSTAGGSAPTGLLLPAESLARFSRWGVDAEALVRVAARNLFQRKQPRSGP